MPIWWTGSVLLLITLAITELLIEASVEDRVRSSNQAMRPEQADVETTRVDTVRKESL